LWFGCDEPLVAFIVGVAFIAVAYVGFVVYLAIEMSRKTVTHDTAEVAAG